MGLPAAGTVHDVSAMPMLRPARVDLAGHVGDLGQAATLLGRRAGDLLDQHRDTDAASADRVEAVLDGHVVVGDDGDDLDAAAGGGDLRGHLEVHHVAGVVLHDVQHAGATVDGLGGRRSSGRAPAR